MPTATTSGTETMHGWELHVSSDRRDAFYAVLVLRTSVIVAWGRRGARGQSAAHPCGSTEAMLRKAAALTDEKAARGYQVTRNVTPLQVPVATAERALGDDSQAAAAAVRELLKAFRAESRVQGNDEEGASQ
jgi:predicted DNA-binding WGR domain protein